MGTKRNQLDATFDAALQLKDVGAVTVDGGATVGGSARVVNVGPAIMQGVFVVDVSALDLAGGDEAYAVILQGSTDSTFATNVSNLARVSAGAGVGEDSFGIGRISRPFINTSETGEPLTYLRAYTDVTGGVGGGSINYQAFVSQNPLP